MEVVRIVGPLVAVVLAVAAVPVVVAVEVVEQINIAPLKLSYGG